MNCTEIHELVASRKTDHTPAMEDEQAVAGAKRIAEFLGAKGAGRHVDFGGMLNR